MKVQDVFDALGLSLPDAFSRGLLFGFSGMAGENLFRQDFCGVLSDNPGEICFLGGSASSCAVRLRFTEIADGFDVVVPDLILADGGAILVTFADAQTIVGRCVRMPAIRLEAEEYVPGERTVTDGEYAYSLAVKPIETGFAFAFCRRPDAAAAQSDACSALALDAEGIAESVLAWYHTLPPCPLPDYEKLWCKCMSVNRVNIFSPQDGRRQRFTTPDRLHPEMRTTDSCFHALALAHYAPEIAKEVLLGVLDCQQEDGFIPDNIQDGASCDTASPYLCMAVLDLFEVTGNLDFLRSAAEPLRHYLEWILKNRSSPNGLMSRNTQTQEPIESLELSVFTAYDLLCLQRICLVLGEHMTALQTESMYRKLADRINARLWDRQTQCYYDRTWAGTFRRVSSPASFLPLVAGLCDPRQAHCLVRHLTPLLGRSFPIVSETDGHDEPGCVRLRDNFFVYVGLQRYGFGALAAELRRKTIEGVERQFCESGKLYALYDPSGEAVQDTAAEFNPSACFIELFLQG